MVSTAAYMKKALQSFCCSRGSCTKSDKLPKVIESSTEAEDYKLENDKKKKKIWACEVRKSEVTRP